jgi:succinate dehydrogenase / fumarate reductase flavoprotein subunit
MKNLDARIPFGPLEQKWAQHKDHLRLLSPANKRRFHVVVIGTGLAGSAAAASLAELGFRVSAVCYQDSPRRAHSIAAQGGINAAMNYQNDGDSVYRLFYDTIKGGDFRSREANVFRLAQVSEAIIDHCVAMGVPFAREYGGQLANRSFGGAQVSRTFYARGQTGQQLLLAGYSALSRQIGLGRVNMYCRHDMLDLVSESGRVCGVVLRNLKTGQIHSLAADAVVLASGGYGNVYYLSTNAKGCNVTAAYQAYKHGALFANPCFTQIHPTCIPVSGPHQSKLTLMSESLRNDGRIWVPRKASDARLPPSMDEDERDYYLERRYPAFGNLVPRDVASRAAKAVCDEGRGVGPTGLGVYMDFATARKRWGQDYLKEKYGNLFHMYEKITAEDPYRAPMRIYPAVHYTMGGLWVDYNLMSNMPGLFVIGEANFSDHGANRLGASALMQGLADGYFILPYCLTDYLAGQTPGLQEANESLHADARLRVSRRLDKLIAISGTHGPDHFHRKLGNVMWEQCGMSRNQAGLEQALQSIAAIRDEFYEDLSVGGDPQSFHQTLEKALRTADFIEFSELMVYDALARSESCGSHFRLESQSDEGEALRDDANFSHVAAWEYTGQGQAPALHRETLHFETVTPGTRSYK